MTENEVKNSICAYLETLPGVLFTLTPRTNRARVHSKYLPVGWPDISGVIQMPSRSTMTKLFAAPFFIEVKKPGGMISKAQHDFILKAESLGAIAFVAESVEDVKKELGAM